MLYWIRRRVKRNLVIKKGRCQNKACFTRWKLELLSCHVLFLKCKLGVKNSPHRHVTLCLSSLKKTLSNTSYSQLTSIVSQPGSQLTIFTRYPLLSLSSSISISNSFCDWMSYYELLFEKFNPLCFLGLVDCES